MNTPDDLELRRALRALRQDEAPAADLWPGIESRLPPRVAAETAPSRPTVRHLPPSRAPWLRWSAVAAGTVLALGLVLLQAGHLARDAAPIESRDIVRTGADTGVARDAVAVSTLPGTAGDSATVLLDAWTQVLASEREGGSQWAQQLALPGGAERIAARRELDASLTQLAAALRLAPESQLLRRLMHQTLQQRASLALTALQA